jgi:predicted nucleic acid-binding protein
VIVLDASVVVELLMLTADGVRIAERIFGGNETLHAPELLDVEVAHVVRRLERAGSLDSARGWQLLEDLADMAIERYPHRHLLPRIWALRANLSAYDATYVALAEVLDAPLLTRDRRLAQAPHGASVEVV